MLLQLTVCYFILSLEVSNQSISYLGFLANQRSCKNIVAQFTSVSPGLPSSIAGVPQFTSLSPGLPSSIAGVPQFTSISPGLPSSIAGVPSLQVYPQDYLAVSLVYPQMGIRMRELGASQFMSGLISSSYGAIQLFSATAHVSLIIIYQLTFNLLTRNNYY